MQRRRVFHEVERWEFHRDQTSAMPHPVPLFNSTVLAAGRTSQETLHSSAFYCLRLGENEKIFSSWFQEYKQILASLNLLLSQTFILLRDVGEKDGHTQGDGYLDDSMPDERFSLSQVICSLRFLRRDDLHWPPPKSTAVSDKVISSNTLHQSVKLL